MNQYQSQIEGDKVAPKPGMFQPIRVFVYTVFALQLLIAAIAYVILPDRVPIHWDTAGQINGYGPKLLAVLLFPAVSIGIYILIRFIMVASPRITQREGQRETQQITERIIAAVILFMLVLQVTTIAITMGAMVDILFVVNLAISVLFIFLGNYMGKLQRNFWAGIRTPWTLASDTVWERTHRVGGWLMVGIGLVGVAMSFIPILRILGIVSLTLLSTLFVFVYSYIVYRRIMHGKDPGETLSPPFEA